MTCGHGMCQLGKLFAGVYVGHRLNIAIQCGNAASLLSTFPVVCYVILFIKCVNVVLISVPCLSKKNSFVTNK